MIQRIQSLFLFQLVLLGLVLMFIPTAEVLVEGGTKDVYLLPLSGDDISSRPGHWAAIIINLLGMVLALITVFIYKRRALQRKLCFILVFLWVTEALMIAFCPFAEGINTPASSQVNIFAVIVAVLGALGALLAARFIKRDINLLKSADRIR